MATATKTITDCGNCAGKIGALEERHEWQGHVVCSSCYAKLAKPAVLAPAGLTALAAGHIECPFCHKDVVPETKAKGSMVVAVLLLLFFIIPGFIYMVMASGHMKVCPQCHTKIADA